MKDEESQEKCELCQRAIEPSELYHAMNGTTGKRDVPVHRKCFEAFWGAIRGEAPTGCA